VAWLEKELDQRARSRSKALFGRALLAVAAPAGLLLGHGSPDECRRQKRRRFTIRSTPLSLSTVLARNEAKSCSAV